MSFIAPVVERDAARLALQDFARHLTREVCVRTAGHGPATAAERRQRDEGPCAPLQLDCVRQVLGIKE